MQIQNSSQFTNSSKGRNFKGLAPNAANLTKVFSKYEQRVAERWEELIEQKLNDGEAIEGAIVPTAKELLTEYKSLAEFGFSTVYNILVVKPNYKEALEANSRELFQLEAELRSKRRNQLPDLPAYFPISAPPRAQNPR